MFEESPIGMCSVAADGTIVRSNAAFQKLGLLDGGSLLNLVIASVRETLALALVGIAAGDERSFTLELPLVGNDDRWCELSGVTMRGGSGDVMVHVLDTSERHRREAGLRELAARDPLTGLHNRLSFHGFLAARLADAPTGTVLLLDLDGFKAVNDTGGHQKGDQVLIAVAAAIRDAMPSEAIVARLGGDEFAVLLNADARAATALATRLIGRIMVAAATVVRAPRVTASVGIATLEDGCDLESVLAAVDRAMYAAKRAGKGRCQVALPVENAATQRHAADVPRHTYTA